MPVKLVSGLCAKLGLAAPEPDAAGGCVMTLPDGFAVVVSGGRDYMDFSGTVHALPDSADEAETFCREMLALSLGRTDKESGAATPRLAVEGKEFVLLRRLPANPSEEEFETNIEEFVNLLEKWRSLASKEQGRQILRAGGGMQGIILP